MDNAKTKDKIPNAAQRFDSIRCDFVLTLSIRRGKEQRGRARLQRVFVDSIMDEARYYRFFVRTTMAPLIRIASWSKTGLISANQGTHKISDVGLLHLVMICPSLKI